MKAINFVTGILGLLMYLPSQVLGVEYTNLDACRKNNGSTCLCDKVNADQTCISWYGQSITVKGRTKTLSGGEWADGGTVSGMFSFDAETNTYESIDIVTTSGTNLSGATYRAVNSSFADVPTNTAFIAFATSTSPFVDLTGTPLLMATLSRPLSNADGDVEILTFQEGVYTDAAGTKGSFVRRASESVPEPASVALLVSGMLGLGIARRRERK